MCNLDCLLAWRMFAIFGLLSTVIALDTESIANIPGRFRSVRAASTKATKYKTVWQPAAGISWQIVLLNPIQVSGTTLSPNVKVWDLDLYDNDASTFKALHSSGKKVICYFSAGSYEDWRYDADQFVDSDLGETMDGWPDERWLDTRSSNVRKIMKLRIALAASKGCDAIDPDNVDGYVRFPVND